MKNALCVFLFIAQLCLALPHGSFAADTLSFAETKALAEQGDVVAQCNLGIMYAKGDGVNRDFGEAVNWFRKAAEQGDVEAQFNLGVMYGNGDGVNRDYGEAADWHRKAAEQGYAKAQYNLGVMYASGKGVRRDYAEALEWYRKAADQGYAGAQNNLGVMYANGQEVRRDYAEALKWYHKAADQGYAGAQFNLGSEYAEGDAVRRDYAEALKWYRKAADQGLAEAQFRLAEIYRDGKGVARDNAEALMWARRAVDQGYELQDARRLLGELEVLVREDSFTKKANEEKKVRRNIERLSSLNSRLPSCTSDYVRRNLLKMKAHGISLLNFKDAREESFDPEEEIRKCSATGYFSTDKRRFYFNIEWMDRDNEQVYISMTVLKWPF